MGLRKVSLLQARLLDMVMWALRLAHFGKILLDKHVETCTAADMSSVLTAQHSIVIYKAHTQESCSGVKKKSQQ